METGDLLYGHYNVERGCYAVLLVSVLGRDCYAVLFVSVCRARAGLLCSALGVCMQGSGGIVMQCSWCLYLGLARDCSAVLLVSVRSARAGLLCSTLGVCM